VQDEGSQLVALALARAPVTGTDGWWLDACAGPGGKASLLAGLLPAGARLLAADLAPHRAALVRQSISGSPAATALVADATKPAWRAAGFDRVLVDAPCTGLGAMRRRPELRWRRQPEDVGRLQQVQQTLLIGALDAARVGGVVAYATCSPHLAETASVVESTLRARPDVELLDARPLLPGVPEIGDGPTVQLWPQRHGTDAMFVAIFRRKLASSGDEFNPGS
jgi:16S rRNA (cytosine967-C5)-methyltransferase